MRSAPSARLRLVARTTLALIAAPLGAQGADEGAPIHLVSPVGEIVIVDRVSAGRLADPRLLRRLLEDCERSLPVSLPVSLTAREAIAALPLTADWARAPVDEWALEIIVVPGDGRRTRCGGPMLAVHAGLARGLQVDRPIVGGLLRDVRDVRIEIDGVLLEDPSAEPLALRRLARTGLQTLDSAAVHISLRLGLLAPDDRGALPTLALHVRLAEDSVVHRVQISPAEVMALWQRALPTRLALGAQYLAGVEPPRVYFPRPRDRYLANGRENFFDGNLSEAARIALVRIEDDTLNTADLRTARAIVGLTFLAQDDDIGARLAFAPLLQSDPCFAFAPGLAPAADYVLGQLERPRVICRDARPWRVALQGTVLPGFGRPSSRSRLALGVVQVAVIATVIGRSQQQFRAAEERYRDYLAVNPFQGLPLLPGDRALKFYREAENRRKAAKTTSELAIALWIATIGESVISELQWGRYFRDITRFGIAP